MADDASILISVSDKAPNVAPRDLASIKLSNDNPLTNCSTPAMKFCFSAIFQGAATLSSPIGPTAELNPLLDLSAKACCAFSLATISPNWSPLVGIFANSLITAVLSLAGTLVISVFPSAIKFAQFK